MVVKKFFTKFGLLVFVLKYCVKRFVIYSSYSSKKSDGHDSSAFFCSSDSLLNHAILVLMKSYSVICPLISASVRCWNSLVLRSRTCARYSGQKSIVPDWVRRQFFCTELGTVILFSVWAKSVGLNEMNPARIIQRNCIYFIGVVQQLNSTMFVREYSLKSRSNKCYT